MCRMCLVEVSGPRGFSLQPACFFAVADGQEVRTDSDKARKAQEGVLEFLLVNHPLDCPVCDKGGECPLQDQSLSHGPGESRFIEEKRHWAKPIDIGPLVALDRERCIQCARCTRFADEVAGDALIDFAFRGDLIEVATFPTSRSPRTSAGNTVQICPVGALTATPYRFKSRPWDLEQVESTCTTCAVGCRVVAQSSAGQLVRFLGVDSRPGQPELAVRQGSLRLRGDLRAERVSTEPLCATATSSSRGRAGTRRCAAIAAAFARRCDGRARVGSGSSAAPALRTRTPTPGRSSPSGVSGPTRSTPSSAMACRPSWSSVCRGRRSTRRCAARRSWSCSPATSARSCRSCSCGCATRRSNGDDAIVECSPVATALSRVRRGAPRATCPARSRALGDGARRAAPSTAPRPDGSTRPRRSSATARARRGDGVVVVLGRPSLAESGETIAAAAARCSPQRFPGATLPLGASARATSTARSTWASRPGCCPGRVALDAGRALVRRPWGERPGRAWAATRPRSSQAAAAGEIARRSSCSAPIRSPTFPTAPCRRRRSSGSAFVVVARHPPRRLELARATSCCRSPATASARARRPISKAGSRRSRRRSLPPGVAWPAWMIATEFGARARRRPRLREPRVASPTRSPRSRRRYAGASTPRARAMPCARATGSSSRCSTVRSSARPRRPIDPIATPGIASVDEPGRAAARSATGDAGAAGRARRRRRRPALATSAPPMPAPLDALDRRRVVDRRLDVDAYSHAARRCVRRARTTAARSSQTSPSLAALASPPTLSVHPCRARAARRQPRATSAGPVAARRARRRAIADDAVDRGVVALDHRTRTEADAAVAHRRRRRSRPTFDWRRSDGRSALLQRRRPRRRLLIVLVKVLVAFGVLLVSVMLMIWFERKVISDMQNRIGPNRAGPFGLLQTLADGIEALLQRGPDPRAGRPVRLQARAVPGARARRCSSSRSSPSAAS